MKEHLNLKKNQLLRNNEYYDVQSIYDNLYMKALNNSKFVNLMSYIADKDNILLAYRNIKNNKGSNTIGTDNKNIEYFRYMDNDEFVQIIQNKFKNYKPQSVRRVDIPKPNGKTRPLGIPSIEDRIIQQCIKQVIEPICESKFHKHSYGFRPNRNTSHAIARCMRLININKLHYVVDIDIKGFFDNVNHSKLKKQLWSLGIRDKKLLCIIGKILKSEIKGIGIPTKGTPQGGIISPLFANIVLNELDWWISSQWETFKTNYKYSQHNKFRALKNTNLKEVWIVRYADDVKVFCRDYKVALKVFNAMKFWLKERLGLEISNEKSKITNLRKNYTEYLGFKLKATLKKNKYICYSRISDKSKKHTIQKLKEQIKKIQKNPIAKEVDRLNSIILGSHNYFRYATHVSKDFAEIDFLVRKTFRTRLKNIVNNKPKISESYKKLYGKYKGKVNTISGVTIFPIYGCTNRVPLNFNQNKCNYTCDGRSLTHDNLYGYETLIKYLLRHSYIKQSVEFSDNKLSLLAGQMGMCYVSNTCLQIGNMECHHKIPKYLGGSDEYKNLVWLTTSVHRLIHSTDLNTIKKYLNKLKLDNKGIKKINSLRKLVGNSVI